MRPTSLLLALLVLACQGAAAPSPSSDERVPAEAPGAGAEGGSTGGAAGAGSEPGGPGALAVAFEALAGDGDCAGLLPDRAPEPVTVHLDPGAGTCGAGTSDGSGAVALPVLVDGDAARWHVYGSDGAPRGAFDAQRALVPERDGFHALVLHPDAGGGDPQVEHVLYGADGRAAARDAVTPDPRERTAFGWRLSQDPRGGAFVVVRSTHLRGNHWSAVEAHRFDGGGRARWPGGVAVGGDDSALEPLFLAGGVSTRGESLVLAQDSAFLDVSWLDAGGHGLAASDGEERSDEVVGPGVAHAIDVVPLLDGSVAVRSDGAFRRAYAHLATTSSPLPGWLADRATSTLRFTRGETGYAVLPPAGRPSADCTQRIELVSPSGRVCGRVVLREEGSACTSGAVDQGWDGTVVQQSGKSACTYRVWPRLLAR